MTHYEKISDLVRMLDIDKDDEQIMLTHLKELLDTVLRWKHEIINKIVENSR